MNKKLIRSIAAKFSEKNEISKTLANRIIAALYSKGLDATMMNRVIYRMESHFRTEKLKQYLEKASKVKIESLVDEIIADDSRYEAPSRMNEDKSEVRVRLFTELKFSEKKPEGHNYEPGDIVQIQVLRVGKWNHQMYGKVKFTKDDLKEVITNFKANKRGTKLAIDENHERNHKALAWIESLDLKGDGKSIFGNLKLTKKGAELLTDGAYRYFSPEVAFIYKDEETGEIQKNLLVGGAFTNRPFFKFMDSLKANEAATQSTDIKFLLFNTTQKMNKFLELVAKFSELEKLSPNQTKEFKAAFSELPDEDQKHTHVADIFSNIEAKFSEEGSDKGDDGDNDEDNEESGDDEGDSGNEDNEDKNDKGNQATKIKASEPDNNGMVTLKASELQLLQSTASLAIDLVKEKRKSKFNEEVKSLILSDKNSEGVISPKDKNKIINFALSLNESQSTSFFNILSDIKVAPTNTMGGKGEEVDISKNLTFSESDAMSYFMEQMGMTQEEAKLAYAEL